ncbi:hypothetical protein FOVG_10166 [Fusarium oxysporum f. sp. pisi HDV247]|uniref:Uncharacterized protein n=1 Tax=Fusarium oxysporum f. sp. pisi HDV247 TaxID=1080344 RepID=W9NZG2_FUSOX|nr:hypothetical protein FOVG_10166 [Fusarium oxysporum f. sp. pisi HDV247]
MPILSDDEVRVLATEVKKQRIEIDALKNIISVPFISAAALDTINTNTAPLNESGDNSDDKSQASVPRSEDRVNTVTIRKTRPSL